MSANKTMHIGVDVTTLAGTVRVIEDMGRDAIVDGDGWETWGEAIGTDVNDHRTVHVVIPDVQDHPYEIENVSRALRNLGHLVPMRANVAHDDVVVILTDSEDWGEGQVEIRLSDSHMYLI